ncbi:site-specific integrase [Sphingomonas sp. S1-29]|uniref:tyrosine-type recombinase/integrase n=1 Tax=Sphingomonas sp. S1-29 TaxID=2991074 RepID=UPI0022406CB3|nr:site-specific integrase [Sphingomonas sp. S1-29]UZK70460.1 site-specific integrase [Sphingomonas sp. S1-29]
MSQPARVLSDSDMRRMLRHVRCGARATRDEVIILLSAKAGLRACEIAGLAWPMVLRPDGKLAVQIQVAGSIAKNGRGRAIPMHPDLRRALQALHRAGGKPLVGPVIQSQRGSHMRPRSIVNWFAQLYAANGLDGCSSHSGRRTFITRAARLLAKSGGSLRDIQELAGHRALSTTERYIEGDRDAQRRLISLL